MEYNKFIDNTVLKADATIEDIRKLCEESKAYDFKSVCINPCFIKSAKEFLKGSDVLICTVIGFPLGSMTTEAKVFEAQDAIKKGADEVDMVINISMLKDKQYDYVKKEIEEIKKAVGKFTLKVIIECCLLTVGQLMGVKAAGGVRTHEEMLEMIENGATRIGTSSGAKLM